MMHILFILYFYFIFFIYYLKQIYLFRDKIHGLEYPVGERIIVKVSGMSSSRIDTSFIDSRF